mgnify:CR=1 FL=1
MKLKNKKRLLQELARESSSPTDFIEWVMALQGQTVQDLCVKAGTTMAHYYVIKSQMKTGKSSIGPSLCTKLSRGLDIDPNILNRLIADYNMQKYLEKEENGINQNVEGEVPNQEGGADT